MRTTSFIAVLAAALLVAACGSPDHEGGEAAPAGSAFAPATSAAATSAAASAPASPTAKASPTADRKVLGPTGFGALRLGMTRPQAFATGLVPDLTPMNGDETCRVAHLKGAPADSGSVTYRPDRGVVAIQAYDDTIHTPEGVHIGMTREELLRVYPEWKSVSGDGIEVDGRGYAKVRGNGGAEYRIVTDGGMVIAVGLQDVNHNCYE